MFKQVYRGNLSETATVASKLGVPGEIRWDTNGQKAYRLVYINEAVTCGDCVEFDTATGSAGYAVIQANGVARPVGVCNQFTATTGAYATGAYAWAQCFGMGSVSLAASDYAANLALIPHTDGALKSAAMSGTNASSDENSWYALPHIAGKTVSSVTETAHTAIAEVWIDMLYRHFM